MRCSRFLFVFLSLMAFFVLVNISCNSDTPQPQGYQTPTIKGVIEVPASSGLKPDDFYLYVYENGFQTKVNSDGSWAVQGLESDKNYSIYFQNRPFNDISLSRDMSKLYGGRKTGLIGTTGNGTNAGIIQVWQTATISGSVIDRGGEPLDAVTVYIPDTPYLAQTGADGTFTLEGVTDGDHCIVVEKGGYVTQSVDSFPVVTSPDNSTAYTLDAVTLVSSFGSIQGTVLFPGTSGVSERTATVNVVNSSNPNIFRTVTTAEDGSFFIDVVPPGVYNMTISAGFSYETYTINGIEVATAGTTIIEPINLVTIGGTLVGKVSTSSGQSPQGAGILLELLSGNEQYYSQVDEDGYFTFENILAGAYSCTVTLDGYSVIKDNVDISVGSEVEHNFTLIPVTGSITGRIILDGASTNAGVSVTATNISDSSYYHATSTTENGTFTIRDLKREGMYQITISREGYALDESITAEVVFGDLTSIGTVTLYSIGATASGSVRLEGLSAHDGVSVVMETVGIEYEETTDRAGEFFFAGLPAGTYTMTISKDGYLTKTVNNVSLAQSENKELGEYTLNVDILPVMGTVHLENSTDHSGILVTAVNTVDSDVTYSTMTKNDGSYKLDGVKLGSYDLTFSCDGYLSYTTRIVVTAGQALTVDATLEKGTAIVSGRVILGGSSNNSGATVTLTSFGSSTEVYSTETGSDGSFRITDIKSEGRYQLTVEADGYVTWNSEALEISFGNVLAIPDVNLNQLTGSIHGTFKKAGASSHSGITVRIEAGEISFDTWTDAAGEFEFVSIPAGTYSLIASASGYESKTVLSVIVVQSRVTEVDTTELPVTLQSITGTATLEGLDDYSDILVTARPTNGGNELSTLTDEFGNYAFVDVLPGTYTITFSCDGYKNYTTTTTVAIGASATADADLKLASGIVTGRVIISGLEDHSGVSVSIKKVDQTDEVYNTVTEADGNWTITGVQHAGIYQITASKDGYATNSSASVTVVLSAVTTVDDITLNPIASTVRGNVELDGLSSHAGISVTLSDSADHTYETETAANGDFTFLSVEPGTYTLTASKASYATGFLTPVVVSPTEDLILDALVLRQEVLPFSGTVTLEDAADHSGVLVTLTSTTDASLVYSTYTDEDGGYSFSSMRVGEYELSFTKDGYQPYSTIVAVIAGVSGSYNAELNLGTGIITGTILLESVDDCSGITVTATKTDGYGLKYSSTTSADGSFIIAGIEEAGTYIVTASKTGFKTDSSSVVTVQLTKTVSIGTITLENYNADITGLVQLEDALEYSLITVTLKDDDGTPIFETQTDSEGAYSFTNVIPEAYYTVTASKAGYNEKSSAEFYVAQSASIEVTTITLFPAVQSVTGTIDIEDSDDETGAVITAFNIDNSEPRYTAISNSQGIFTLVGVEPGFYKITVSKSGYLTVTLDTVEVVSSSGNLDLGTIVLPLRRGTINGVARLEGRTDHSGTLVEVVGLDGFSATTDKNGEYVLKVPEGYYSSGLCFSREDYETTFLRDVTVITGEDTIANDIILTCTAASIKGIVTIRTIDDASGVSIAISGTDFQTVTGVDGSFQFDHVPLGEWTLEFSKENMTNATKKVTLEPCEVMDVGTITLIPNAANVTGQVLLDGMKDNSEVVVTATPVGEGGEISSTESDTSGYFRLLNLDTDFDYVITFSKDGWVSEQIEVNDLTPLEERDITADGSINLFDTTAPVLSKVTINDGANTSNELTATITLDASDFGSGLDRMQYCFDGVFDETVANRPFNKSFTVEFPEGNGDKTIYVRVIDASGNVSATASATVTLVDIPMTGISGVLSGDRLHWTKINSPYMVTGDVLVPEGETLIIDPGVDVQFDGAWFIQIEGSIQAVGTESERIKFYGIDEGVDTWEGIQIIGDDSTSVLDHIDLYDAKYGIGGYATVSNSTIVCEGPASSYTDISNFTGIMKNCELNIARYYFSSATCEDVVIVGRGESVGMISFDDYSNTSFINCTISDVGEISNDNRSNTFFINCTISDVGEISNENRSFFINCTISDVGELLISSMFSAYSFFFSCELERVDSISISEDEEGMTMNNCNLVDCAGVTVAMKRSSIAALDFRNNYWGEAWTSAFNESIDGDVDFIYDYYDDFNLSRIDYSGYLDEPIEGIGRVDNGPAAPELPAGVNYVLGDIGPSGGKIVYVDEENTLSEFDYIEAVSLNETELPFGYYRQSSDAVNEMVGTSEAVGSGMENTKALVEAMGNNAYTESSGSERGPYAALIAAEAGWALPSSGDLNLVYGNGYVFFSNAWSSTERDASSAYRGTSTSARSTDGTLTLIRYY